ncbi:MAG: helix-turn-helix domain-containing protein [Candidatus Omnitrophica bacterium]|nr:helix-turn-helix domain-containing protein [Candidatus Omnitrophota bacterium]
MSVGQELKQAREELRLDVKELAHASRIQPWVLEALEADELHRTMSPVYVKAFLMKYAKALRLDPAPLVARLLPPPPAAAPEPSAAPVFTGESLGTTSASLAWSYAAWRRLGTLAVSAAVIAAVVVVNPWKWLTLRWPHEAASLSVRRQPGVSAPAEMLLQLEPHVPLELTVVAKRRTWILVKADGKLVAQRQLTPGTQELWKANRRFELVLGSPSHTDVLINGHSISPMAMAHDGRLVITHQRVQPLASRAPTPAPASSPKRSAQSKRSSSSR